VLFVTFACNSCCAHVASFLPLHMLQPVLTVKL